jgi:hypothetical protein
MELRNHPGMIYRGVRNWPPVWTRVRKARTKTVRGEIGVLSYVFANNRISNKCYLVIDYERESYIGCLIFNDLAMCTQIAHFLQNHIGRAIKEVGDLDVSYTL